MPLEINEIVIRASISEDAGNQPAEMGNNEDADGINSADIIEACVERVLEILREKEEK